MGNAEQFGVARARGIGAGEAKWDCGAKLVPERNESPGPWYRILIRSFGKWKLTEDCKQESDTIDLLFRMYLWIVELGPGWGPAGSRTQLRSDCRVQDEDDKGLG